MDLILLFLREGGQQYSSKSVQSAFRTLQSHFYSGLMKNKPGQDLEKVIEKELFDDDTELFVMLSEIEIFLFYQSGRCRNSMSCLGVGDDSIVICGKACVSGR